MRGQWLAKAGFEPGRKLEVRVMDECIVITAKICNRRWKTLCPTFRSSPNVSNNKSWS
ncbi:SymE family type I addiction module toxin [Pseudescherichia vulneris]